MKYVDPEGEGPWDNKNIRLAKNYAEKVDGVYQEWTNSNGYQSASVQTCSVTTNDQGTYEVEVTATVFPGTQSNQHNVVWNMVEAFEDATGVGKEGHSDCANEGTITNQDVAVATGVIGIILAGIEIGAAYVAGTVTTYGVATSAVGVVNGLDDAGTNAQGESFIQQQMSTESGKNTVGYIKAGASVLTVGSNLNSIVKSPDCVQKAAATAEVLNTTAGTAVNLINNNEEH